MLWIKIGLILSSQFHKSNLRTNMQPNKNMSHVITKKKKKIIKIIKKIIKLKKYIYGVSDHPPF